MAQDISKVRMRTAKVIYDGVELGHTLGGVTFTIERDLEDMVVDKYGTSPIDKVLTGNRLRVTFVLAQPDISSFDAAVPEGLLEQGSVSLEDRLGLGRDAGHQLRPEAKVLRLHPVNLATADQSEDVVIYKAVSIEAVETGYRVDEQQGVEITMEALVDETYLNGRRLGHIGPDTIS